MNLLLSLFVDLLAGSLNVAAIRWPEASMPGTLPETAFERRRRKVLAFSFLLALIVIPLVVTGWILL